MVNSSARIVPHWHSASNKMACGIHWKSLGVKLTRVSIVTKSFMAAFIKVHVRRLGDPNLNVRTPAHSPTHLTVNNITSVMRTKWITVLYVRREKHIHQLLNPVRCPRTMIYATRLSTSVNIPEIWVNGRRIQISTMSVGIQWSMVNLNFIHCCIVVPMVTSLKEIVVYRRIHRVIIRLRSIQLLLQLLLQLPLQLLLQQLRHSYHVTLDQH